MGVHSHIAVAYGSGITCTVASARVHLLLCSRKMRLMRLMRLNEAGQSSKSHCFEYVTSARMEELPESASRLINLQVSQFCTITSQGTAGMQLG